MLNHTYTSVKNANLVDCGKKQHIPSQPSPLLKENFLGEFRTELDRKKVLANLGIITELSLEWEYIKGDISRSEALMQELDSRTKYISEIDGFKKSLIDGVKYLESVIGGEQKGEEEQNKRLTELETLTKDVLENLNKVKEYITNTTDVAIETLNQNLSEITDKVNNITNLIQVSSKAGNALVVVTETDVQEGETPGLYVHDLSKDVLETSQNLKTLQTEVEDIQDSLDDFVTREELGGGDFDFVSQDVFNAYAEDTDEEIESIKEELVKTVKTGEDGHVDTLFVNKISKNNTDDNIQITDSFEMESGIPLDVRFVVKSINQLHTLKPNVCYAGMGVIVSDQASLYILREPVDGIIDEAYIKDEKGINWRCPEDLVIEVLTQEEYNKKVEEDSINPNMFYYIHEEVVEEPNRKDFDTDEAYTEALNHWLRVLLQKYMSAVWGQEIESLVANKASTTAVKSLESEIQRITTLINKLSGGEDNVDLKTLNSQVTQNRTDIDLLINEDGTIPTIQKNLSNLQKQVSEDYVTKEDITTDNPSVEYIFVKKSDFINYTTQHDQAIADQVTTKEITTNKVILGEQLLTSDTNGLFFNETKVALNKDVPIIELIENSDFEKKEEKDENTYYMVYNTTERYILDSEFTQYKTSLTQVAKNLSDGINKNQTSIGELALLTTDNKNTLVLAINELLIKINNLTSEVQTLKEQLNNSQTIE